MNETILAWIGLGLLLILCLPFPVIQRTLLTVYGLALRLGLLALVAGAGYLWFRPAELPEQIADAVRNSSLLNRILPEPGTPLFGVCAVSLIAAFVLPLIAVIDVSRRSRVVVRQNVVASEPIRDAIPVAPGAPVLMPSQSTIRSRFGRRAAADALTQAGASR